MFTTRSGKVLHRQPTDWGDWHNLDDIATRKQPYTGTWNDMEEHVCSLWPLATYNNSAGAGFWSMENVRIMVAECWPHQTKNSLWRWRIATTESGGRIC